MGAQLAGLAVGPLVGSLVGLAHFDVVFVAAAILSVAACVPAVSLLGLDGASPVDVPPAVTDAPSLTKSRGVRGALVAAAALGLVIGVYEACWTLLLHHRGAHDWQIGLSWTLFAIPFVVMARPAGWLADRFDRRLLVVCSLLSSIAFCCSYPFIGSLGALVALGAVEAVGFALLMPSAQSMLTQSVPDHEHGRAQGIFGTAETGAIALSASLGGALFAVSPWVPFVSAGVLSLVLTLVVARVWSSVPGRVDHLEPAPAGA
jgi:DHA1 family multidrug resistance protein-like MFS transporter